MSFRMLFWLAALSYLIAAYFFDYPLDYAHKALPAVILAIWVSTVPRSTKTIVAAFVFCAAGDLMLAIPFENNFISGLLAFMIAQLLFAFSFWQWRKWYVWKLVPTVLLIILSIALSLVILPSTGNMELPVGIYIAVIFSMAFCALLATHTNFLLMAGAFVFMFSDSLIGINRFVNPLPYEHFAIMTSYYLALFLLAVGIVKRAQIDPPC